MAHRHLRRLTNGFRRSTAVAHPATGGFLGIWALFDNPGPLCVPRCQRSPRCHSSIANPAPYSGQRRPAGPLAPTGVSTRLLTESGGRRCDQLSRGDQTEAQTVGDEGLGEPLPQGRALPAGPSSRGRSRHRSDDLALFRRALYRLSYPTAVLTGFEPAASGLTGRRALQTAPQDQHP